MPRNTAESTAIQEWIRRRADAVRKSYSAFDCMVEHGQAEMLVDPTTPVQVFCPFHGNVNTPAARYYPSLGGRSDYVRCYRCKESWDCLNLYMKFQGLDFMESLKRLERRYGIRIPQKPEVADFAEPIDKSSSNYVSPAWRDVPRVMTILEKKMLRLREAIPLPEYVKFCRVLDSVQWDLDHGDGKPTEGMIQVLSRLRGMVDGFSKEDTSALS